MKTLIALVLSTFLSGCVQVDYPDTVGTTPTDGCDMSDLFKGLPGGSFGNSVASVPPSQKQGVAPIGWGEIKTVVKFPGHMRKGNMAHETDPCMITASVFAQPNPDANFVGPLTGIALWGSGGSATHQAEFDIPVGTSFDPDFVLNDPAPFDTPKGGTLISVVGTSLEIRARNDANLIPAGPDGKGTNQLPVGGVGAAALTAPFAPAFVSAALGVGPRAPEFTATKTIFSVLATPVAGSLAAGQQVSVRVPPFAKAYRIARRHTGFPGADFAGAIQFIEFGGLTSGEGPYTVASGVIAPIVDLSGWSTTLTIINAEAAAPIITLYVVFFLAI